MSTTSQTIKDPAVRMDWSTGSLAGEGVRERVKRLRDLKDLFYDARSWRETDPDTVVYRVCWWETVPEGTEGGLLWGTTTVVPGRIGDEYFMTHGHYHRRRNRAEIYSTITGTGMLVMAEPGGGVRMEPMTTGSTHYVRGEVAHRVANIGSVPLVFVACWPSDAGHDYGTVLTERFGTHLVCRNGVPTLLRDVTNAG
jgi:glucose-6-phosphate isomerase, archaeal